MRMLKEFFPEFTDKLDEIDDLYKENGQLMKRLTNSYVLLYQ